MKKAEYDDDGYYVITGEKEYWCPTMRGAFETQDMFGGEVLTAEGRNIRKMGKSKTSKEVKDRITTHLVAVVSEAVDYFEASGDRIDEAVEKFNRARTHLMIAMLESDDMTQENKARLQNACSLIDNSINILTGGKK